MIWYDGPYYEGDWDNDQMDGHGKFAWKDGKYYIG
jgi:hypothetical protein